VTHADHERVHLVRGTTALLGQLAHLLGDHGEAAAGVAGARRLDRCVEREEIGLIGHRLDGADEAAHGAERRLELVHLLARPVDHVARALQHLERSGDSGAGAHRRRADLVAELPRAHGDACQLARGAPHVRQHAFRRREALALRFRIARDAGQPVRVVSLAAHQESMGMTLALVDNLPLATTIAGATAAWLVVWSFLSGGVLDRYARQRPTRAAGFFAAPPGADQIVIVGDTPHDIDCAKAHGARALAVATGPFGRETLADAGADLALETLEPVDRIVEWLVRGGSQWESNPPFPRKVGSDRF